MAPRQDAFFDEATRLVLAGDPRLVRLGRLAEAGEHVARRAGATRGRIANMQQVMTLSLLRRNAALQAETLARGVVLREIHSPTAFRSCPLAPNFLPDLRVGPVLAPMLVSDDEHVFLAGPPGTPHAGTIWETTDAGLVAAAVEVFEDAWRTARPWSERTDRPLLPARTFAVALRLVDGESDREIAADLGISARTASAEVRRLIDWCGARSRGHAIAVLVGGST